MTVESILFLSLFLLVGVACCGHLVVAAWLLTRSETRLRASLEPDDVDTYSNHPADEAYLSDAGRADRRHGWSLIRRGLLVGALLIPLYGLAVLLHIPGAA